MEGLIDYADSTPPAVEPAFRGSNCGTACSDITDPSCSCTLSFYWSASASVGQGTAWFLDFFYGEINGYFRDTTNYVRAVRTGP